MHPDFRARPGLSLVELVVALPLVALAGVLLVTLLGTESRLAGHAADRSEALEAARTSAAVLGADLALLSPASDLAGLGADSAALRVFRGHALVCGFVAGDPLVRYRGLRHPDPMKDSLLVLTATPEQVDVLAGSSPAPGTCTAAAGEEVFRLRTGTALRQHDAVLIFESGSYHIAGALRYRRGAGGRQPVTADVFTGASRLTVAATGGTGAPAAIAVDFVPRRSAASARGVPLAPPARLRIPLRNREQP
jgi:hypothetical protein